MDEQLINFEDEDKDMHDVVLIVQGKKFFCFKIILAKNSGTMKSMFFGPNEERNKSKIKLYNVSVVDFNNFLLLIHGALEVNDDNLVGLLKLSNMWLVLKKCRDFLMHNSEKLHQRPIQFVGSVDQDWFNWVFVLYFGYTLRNLLRHITIYLIENDYFDYYY
ncbi:hypothetical protein CAEBREN_18568 [Caenorhabditis brenneri]|uniref:BTB domain-containing protein n=1 Tax=Caenorhabditis brenneri TaxID=135651 RepID=G0NYQ0_CAEBE|nr:hypothetical protein CAEBREN_18568 [Caenorhabditis brenneri]